jgi:hypothetical protein
MTLRKERTLLRNLLLGAGVYMLDSLRHGLSENAKDFRESARDRYDDLRDRAGDFYSTASDRLGRANDALRGDDHAILSSATAALIGIGVGVGLGMLLAPASGEETRSNLKEKVRSRFSEREPATGTFGG